MNNNTEQNEKILVLDFGGQYNQLIARRVREMNVYAEVEPYTLPVEEIRSRGYKGIIFTGGPNSVYGEAALPYDPALFELGIPILGICYGAQLMAHALGGKVETAPTSEYGRTEVVVDGSKAGGGSSLLMGDVSPETVVWMSHTDYIAQVPEGFSVTAHSEVCPVAAME